MPSSSTAWPLAGDTLTTCTRGLMTAAAGRFAGARFGAASTAALLRTTTRRPASRSMGSDAAIDTPPGVRLTLRNYARPAAKT